MTNEKKHNVREMLTVFELLYTDDDLTTIENARECFTVVASDEIKPCTIDLRYRFKRRGVESHRYNR